MATLVSEVSRHQRLHYVRAIEVTHREWAVSPPHTLHPAPYQSALFTAFLVLLVRVNRIPKLVRRKGVVHDLG